MPPSFAEYTAYSWKAMTKSMHQMLVANYPCEEVRLTTQPHYCHACTHSCMQGIDWAAKVGALSGTPGWRRNKAVANLLVLRGKDTKSGVFVWMRHRLSVSLMLYIMRS